MIFIRAAFFFALAQYRRKKGTYNYKTLSFYEKACELSPTSSKIVAFAKFQRDINGIITSETLQKLEAIPQGAKNAYAQANRLLLEKKPERTSLASISTDTNYKTILHKQKLWREELLSWLDNKSIAVVGNGVNLEFSNLGESIEAQAIICRFNLFPKSTSARIDTGKRTDIWIVSPEIATSTSLPDANIKWIIVTGGDVRFTLQNWQWSQQHLKNNRRIITVPVQNWSELIQQFEAPPSAGILWLSYLLSQPDLKIDLHLYGFDRHINQSSKYHITSSKYKPSNRHAWKKERVYLDQLSSKPNVTQHFGKRIGVFTKGLLKNNFLKRHLSSCEFVLKPDSHESNQLDGIVGWGRKQNTNTARRYADSYKLVYFTLEDGFIHSMSQGRLGAQSWSLVKDSTGIFYDATTSSDLEILINERTLNSDEVARSKYCLSKLTKNHITKYNNTNLVLPDSLKNIKQAILVIDQVEGDTSIPYAFAKHSTFNDMLIAALTENPHSTILLKIHPDVINGRRKGCISADLHKHSRITIVSENINPLVLMEVIEKVYVVSSQMGFEALLMGKPVVCFGAPFYAGWGLTEDRNHSLAQQRRIARPDIVTLFHCAYIDYSSYIHPETKTPCEIEDILNYVAFQNHYYRKNAGQWLCIGLAPWKRQFIRHYLKSHDNEIYFVKHASQADTLDCDETTKLLIWSSKFEVVAKAIQRKYYCQLFKVEDGFIRSIGLGVNYTLPSSLVLDSKGIYFDPNQPSDIEYLLANYQFDNATLKRAQSLTELIISKKISKYNTTTSVSNLARINTEQFTILIPGQVANDASIVLGCPDIADNLSLIRRVREENKSAQIIYKPHPDVISGRREGAIDKKLVLEYCDAVVDHISISDCLRQVDEVHTMTSLVGFEALLREIPVHCYGVPFYAGWGLTIDKIEHKRRSRRLSVRELVAGAILLYPRYFNWERKEFTTPESVIATLSESITNSKEHRTILDYIPQKLRLIIHFCYALIKAR